MTNSQKFSRRGVLKELIRWPAAGSVLFLVACSKGGKLMCANPGQLTPDETNLRTSLHYTEDAPDVAKTCSGCGFFSAAQPKGCGECQMLKGIVNANGHCDSWSAKG